MEEILMTFLGEAKDLIDEVELELLALERGEGDTTTINRSMHTLKGSALSVGFDDIGNMAHKFEGAVLKEVADFTMLFDLIDNMRLALFKVAA